eukprot:CAMPEP_0174743680 /NCGR_PEP_ID=MMETSP1094-20130205/82224_1 /TAXON_ID=156173 /ORGANISM="Chrysochromulina brevifilum, Strain UTEX LB 985" /LENGTH=91 /DNA_ID=CAMNT_0015947937 /DNA_START=156 /DNA_END=431 /DNA_ORIENTATION=-
MNSTSAARASSHAAAPEPPNYELNYGESGLGIGSSTLGPHPDRKLVKTIGTLSGSSLSQYLPQGGNVEGHQPPSQEDYSALSLSRMSSGDL